MVEAFNTALGLCREKCRDGFSGGRKDDSAALRAPRFEDRKVRPVGFAGVGGFLGTGKVTGALHGFL
jgi:hypothetical protein